VLAAIVAVFVVIGAVRMVRRSPPAMRVQVTSGGSILSRDATGTDVMALIDNPNPVPVDVVVRVRGYDISDRVVVEQRIGPFRRVPPGGPYPVEGHLATTPLKSVSFDAVDVRPTAPPEP
jgi:hypothetical protein